MTNLFNPQHLNNLCQKYNLRPSKSYGQNYLISPEIVETIVLAANLKSSDIVIEVGPGFGVLTLALIPKIKNLLAFEIEKKLEPYWDNELKKININEPKLQIIWGNALKELSKYIDALTKYKVVANIPYQITSNLIKTLLELKNPPQEMILMVQKEVAQRICAPIGEASILSLSVAYYATAEIIAFVPKHNFYPAPKVDSALIKITPKQNPENILAVDFFDLIKIGFSSRRKTLYNNLKSKYKKLALTDLENIGFNPQIRAQELSLNDWQKLAKILSTKQ